jgi:GTP-binding protein
MNRLFEKYGPYKGKIEGRKNGVLISNGAGEAVAYALGPLEERGILFVGRGQDKLYEGMIIGENAKPDDLEVNPMKSKQLTNFRSTGKDDAIRLTPPRIMTLEQAIAYIDDDEMVEVTPQVDPPAQGAPRPARAQEGLVCGAAPTNTPLTGMTSA